MNLLGLAEISELLGVSKQAVANWRARRDDFPNPIATLKSGPVWSEDAVRSWAAAEGLAIQAAESSAPESQVSRHASVVSIMNMKGGVGKSTLAANLGWYGAIRRDLRVLLIDLDPQFNLSQYVLGVSAFETLLAENQPTIESIFRQNAAGKSGPNIGEIINVVNEWDDGSCLHLIPANLDLAWTMRFALEKAHVLRDAVSEVKDRYDVIIIDCSPTESILTWASYLASDYILVPVKPEFLSTIGLPLLVRSLKHFADAHRNDPVPEIIGILFNDVSDRVEHNRSREYVQRLAHDNNIPIFKYEVSHSDSYPAGARSGKPIFWTDNARDAKKSEFSKVAAEFFQRIGR
ncbi:ParA family protein [Stakelama tenebrarum]|uniref:ParA family protein n=1 Tax=Stakelama tenebrarum TaxID=2711215 RepID=A0A6G6Y3M4_9SPHN|nr:ParA family protein [Sphingosinithalassobacter tenebrarum]QIG79213.1 ParA family protein [Sphingosinithalassobacter tenebrarum]